MNSLPTARGELPRLYELDPLRFQDLCRDLYSIEPDCTTADVFGTPGQLQRGVDILATRRAGNGIGVGQCKRVKPDALKSALLRKASKEFLEHLAYWQKENIRRFILFVASDTSPTQIQEESLQQRDAFKELGIEYELWGEAAIVSKLRSQPGITNSYLGSEWTDILCGTAMSGFPTGSVVLDRVLRTQIETLASHVSGAAAAEIEALREGWRGGRRTEVIVGVSRLKEPSRWQTFSSPLRATILRFEAQLALEADDLPRAKQLAAQATTLDPDACVRLHALIARAENNREQALDLLADVTDHEGITLRATLLMEEGQISGALSLLEQLGGYAEAHRIRALGLLLQRDLSRAKLEIEKAIELAPDWRVTRYTRAIVHYLSGLSPAALPNHIPQWPVPEEWHYIKTDDGSLAHFASAVETVARIEKEREVDPEERREYEAWHIGGLANDPGRRDEATAYCREALERDPGNYRMVVWALARRLEVDLTQARVALRERCDASEASVPEVIALLVLYAQTGDLERALDLLRTSKSLFVKEDVEELLHLWETRLAALRGEMLALPAARADAGPAAEAALIALRARAQATNDSEPLILELRTRAESGDAAASFELCRVYASCERWQEALPIARTLPDLIRTPEAVALSCIALYHAKQHEECLRTLDTHRGVFPHAELPNEMRRLRLAARRELGLFPSATADAEDLFRREPSTNHFHLLSELYFEKGDFASLVVLARRHERFPDLRSSDLLRLSMHVSVEDRSVATALWRRASKIGLADDEVTVALDLGYKLGLDREVRPLVERLNALATKPDSSVRRVTLDDVREMLVARRDNLERVNQKYRAGEIPVHMLAQHPDLPLASRYHRAPLLNQESGRSVAGPTYVRHGGRVGMSVALDPQKTACLHADLTALLLAHHLDILKQIEGSFGPIVLPHWTIIALAEMRDAARPNQPARRDALRVVHDLVARNRIKVVGRGTSSSAITTIPGLDTRSARHLAQATDSNCLLVDFLPLTGESTEPLQLAPEHEVVLRSGHCVVESLHAYGEISEPQRVVALEVLGPEHAEPLDRSIPKGVDMLCASGILERLAAGYVLEHTTRLFAVQVDSDDFEQWVQQPLAGLDAAEEDVTWLTRLINQVNRGIDRGVYRVLPDLRDERGPRAAANENSPVLNCLSDLLRFKPRHGDVIWADDRWLTGLVHRDGVPILDSVDLLHILRDRAELSEADFFSIIHRLREGDFRLVSFGASEIKTLVRQATVKDGEVIETRELRTLRRQYAAALSDGDTFRIAPDEKGTSLEWAFVLASGHAVVNALAEIWQDAGSPDVVEPRAAWILGNLYVPDRGRAFMQVDRFEDGDHQLEAVALSALLFHMISFPIDPASRETRRAYLKWIYQCLLRYRFEADPTLGTTAIDVFKEVMTNSVDGSKTAEKDRQLAVALIRELLVDLPEEIRATLAEDGDFLGRLGISLTPVVSVGPHEINAEELWSAAAHVLTAMEPTLIDASGQELTVLLLEERGERQVVVEDAVARIRYVVLSDTVGILSDSVSEREATLRGVSELFDLRASAVDDAIARVAALDDAASRVIEVGRLQRYSAQNHYLELGRLLKTGQPVGEPDVAPASIDAVVRHLRLEDDMSGSLEARLERAATTLIGEVGLEETLIRIAGLPVPLPAVVVNAVSELTPHDRRSLLKHLVCAIGKSPIGSAHAARLFMQYADDNPAYRRYAHTSMRHQILSCESSRCAAWLEVLRVCAKQLSYGSAFRLLPVDIRLCVAWSHADRVFRILINSGVDPGWIQENFGRWSTTLPTEVAFADDGYATDVASPRRVMALHMALAGCGYALEEGTLLDKSFRTMVSSFVQSDPAIHMRVMRDLTLAPNVLNCILCRDGRRGWLSVLTDELREKLRPEVLRSQLAEAADVIRSGSAGFTEWGFVQMVVADDPVPSDLSVRLREGLLTLDLGTLHEKDRLAALLAASWSSQHATAFGEDVLSHVRSQLIALATVRSREKPQPSQDDVEHAGQTLLSAALDLYGRLDSSGRGGRFAKIGELLDDLVHRWPALIDQSQVLVDRLVEGLPNRESRGLWRLQVKLRGAR